VARGTGVQFRANGRSRLLPHRRVCKAARHAGGMARLRAGHGHLAHSLRCPGNHPLGRTVSLAIPHPVAVATSRFQFRCDRSNPAVSWPTAGSGSGLLAALDQAQAGWRRQNTGGIEGHQISPDCGRHSWAVAPWRQPSQQTFHHKRGGLGVAGVVEVVELSRRDPGRWHGSRSPADHGQQLRSDREALALAPGSPAWLSSHAEFL